MVFNVLDLIVGLFIVIAAFVSFSGSFEGIIIPIYEILFGALICVMVFYIPPQLSQMIPFYMNFLGRGLTFLFLGCLVLVGSGNQGMKTATAVITLMVAFAYIIFWVLARFKVLVCLLPPPFTQANKDQDDAAGGPSHSEPQQQDQ